MGVTRINFQLSISAVQLMLTVLISVYWCQVNCIDIKNLHGDLSQKRGIISKRLATGSPGNDVDNSKQFRYLNIVLNYYFWIVSHVYLLAAVYKAFSTWSQARDIIFVSQTNKTAATLVSQTSPLSSCLRFLFYLVTGHVSENVLLRVNRHKIFCAPSPTPSRSLSAWVSVVVSSSVVVRPREIRIRKVRLRGKGFSLGAVAASGVPFTKTTLKKQARSFSTSSIILYF